MSALLSLGLAWYMLPPFLGWFLLFGMRMFIQCLYNHSILEVNNLFFISHVYSYKELALSLRRDFGLLNQFLNKLMLWGLLGRDNCIFQSEKNMRFGGLGAECYGLGVVCSSPPNVIFKFNPRHSVAVLGSGAWGGYLGHEGESLMNGLVLFLR